MSIEEILADVKQEGEDPFATLEKETPAESQTEKEPETKKEEDKPEEGENTPEEEPFHKRWEKHAENLKAELEAKHQQDFETYKRELDEKYKRPEPSDSKIPDWFKELYGENETAWQKYEEHEKAKEIEIETRMLHRQEEAKRQTQQETERWNKWVDDEIGKLTAEGKQFDRNELIKTMLDYRPTDESNNFDFK